MSAAKPIVVLERAGSSRRQAVNVPCLNETSWESCELGIGQVCFPGMSLVLVLGAPIGGALTPRVTCCVNTELSLLVLLASLVLALRFGNWQSTHRNVSSYDFAGHYLMLLYIMCCMAGVWIG